MSESRLLAVDKDLVTTEVNKEHKCDLQTNCVGTLNKTVTAGGPQNYVMVMGDTTLSHQYEVGDTCTNHIGVLDTQNFIGSTVLIGGLPVAKQGDLFAAPCGGQIVGGLNTTVYVY